MNQTEINNAAHNKGLQQHADFIKSGGTVEGGDIIRRDINKDTINRKSSSLQGSTVYEKCVAQMKKHKKLTRLELAFHSGVGANSVSSIASKMKANGLIKRYVARDTTVTYKWVGE